MDIKSACDAIRTREAPEIAALVINDKNLQCILAVWPMVRREELPGVTGDMSLSDLWSVIKVDEREVSELSGLTSGVGIATYRRAKALGLIYPDGSIHAMSRGVLRKIIKDGLK